MSEPDRTHHQGSLTPRPRLFALLDQAVRRHVTLLLAGPGWGKSALVRSWLEARSRPAGWLTLNAGHRDTDAFLRAAAAVLEPQGVVVSDGCAQDPPAPVTLVLDDFQMLDGAPVVAELAPVVESEYPWLRLILLTRTEPGLPLHRLRAAGELTEIGAPELAFTASEAAALPWSPQVSELERTEGWALGLRLAARARRPEEATRDYLLNEVVSAQPPAVRRFLQRTSIPDLISAGLAAALTGETHGQQILEHLQRTSGFATRQPGDSPWFRYHRQLRDALRRQFELEEPDATLALHGLAARWYARHGALPEALRHATVGGDWAYVGRLIAERAVALIAGSHRPALIEALRAIPADLLPTTAELSLCGVLLMFVEGNIPAVPSWIARARRLLVTYSPDRRLAIDAALGVLEAGAITRRNGDMPRLVAQTSEILEQLRPARPDQMPTLPEVRAFALNNKGVGLLWLGKSDKADQYLWAGLTAARAAGAQVIEINARGYLGLLAYLQGSLAEAEDHATAAGQLAHEAGMEATPQAAMAHLTIALIELERHRLAEAQAAMRRALHSAINPTEAITVVLASLVRVQLLLAGDDPGAAAALLADTREEIEPTLIAPRLDRWLRLTGAEVALALRQPERVVKLYRLGALAPAEQACLGRAYLELGDYAAAEEPLARAANSPDMVAAVTAWIALALLAEAQGHISRSVDAMTRADTLARRNGIRRPFRRFDPARISALAGRQRWLAESDSERGAVFEPPTTPAEPLSEPLSERERDVLRYLPTVLTAAEIAASLGISVNTVKAHLRSIYRKLGAARRREAVVRARRLGLL